MKIPQSPVVVKIKDSIFSEKGISLSVLRLDEIHPFISGNKWYKLKYNIEEFFRLKKEYLVTFGGAYSNHIVATASAGKEYGIKTIGIIRGDELTEDSNPSLRFAAQCGMELLFATRDEYRQLRNSGLLNVRMISELGTQNSELYIIPEGGPNAFAVQGCAEIPASVNSDFDFICCACGTGATLAGITTALNENQQAIGVSVLHGEKFLENNILKMNGDKNNFRLIHDYSFGGYAKSNDELDSFCNTFLQQHHLKIEPVYTGKLFFALYNLIKKDFFSRGSKIIALHTGGITSFPQ